MENVLDCRNLRKSYKEFTLDDVSLSVPKGAIQGLIGPNGAGKTTTIRILMNQIRADGGDVDILGLHYPAGEKAIKNRIGFVGEEQFFYLHKSVGWTGRFVAQYYSRWDENRFDSLLMRFKISRTKKTRELSKGMKVKLAFALALAHNPELLILDEPTSGLDPVIRRELLDLLRDACRDEGKSVLISSHITDDLARIADYITFMNEGRIVLCAAKDDLLANWKKIHFRQDALPDGLIATLLNLEVHAFGSSGITREFQALKSSLAEAVARDDVRVENVTLDDILIALVRKGA
jgi:ABC-2 type transport system ATP-binding protein